MVVRLALVILGLCSLPVAAAQDPPRCLDCHPVHFRQAGTCVDCHRGEPRSVRRDLAHHDFIPAAYAAFTVPGSPVVEQGDRLLDAFACRRCHVTGGSGNRLAGDLDRVARVSAPSAVAESVRRPALLMPDFALPDAHLVPLVNALYAAAEDRPPPAGEVPRVVHFATARNRTENPFVRHCGACHQLLSHRDGGLGGGMVAPNLSGLLTPYYPRTFREGERWSLENLRRWLDNPRQIRDRARMPPVKLDPEKERELFRTLKESSPPEVDRASIRR